MDIEKFYRDLLDSTNEGIYFVDNNRKITFWNKGAERITGYSYAEVINKYCYDNILNHIDNNGNALCFNGCPLMKTIEDGQSREIAVYLQHKRGHRVTVNVRAVPIYQDNEIVGAVELFNDDIERHELRNNLDSYKTLTMHDQLTGLPNRRFLESFISSRMNDYNQTDMPFAVALLDIDKFKNFNDTYGHQAGDNVLKMISDNIINVTRSSDLIGRWGGEEFLGIFTNIDEEGLQMVTDKIRIMIESSNITYKANNLNVTISIGATLFKKSDTIESIIKRADDLLYKSKANGRNIVSIG